jgi:alpha-glucosidase
MGMMIKQRYSLILSLLFFGMVTLQVHAAGTSPGKYVSHEVSVNSVTFHCENQISVRMEQLTPGIFKIWYDTDGFHANNASFAVIDENFTNKEKLNISETPQNFEIYTSSLIVRIQKNPFQIQFFDKYQKLLLEDFQENGFVKEEAKMLVYKSLRPNETIYGLGEKNGSINRRGQQFKMWNSDKPCYSTTEDPLYKSIPFFFSNFGYGIFFDNTFKTTFDFGATSNEFYSFGTPGGEMIYYFIFGPSYKQIIQNYIQLTGNPIMPPNWALGFAQCRGLLTNEKLTRDIAKGYRDRQIPLDIIYQDIGWTNYLQNFEWREGNYTDPVKMLSDLEKDGFKVIVSQDPVISQNNKKQWMEADSLGYFTKDIRTGKSYDMPWPWGGNCGVVDFTKPEVADWWGTYQQKAIDAGVRGFWTDMGEPAWSNEESAERLFMQHHLGMHNEMHNVYGMTWDKVVTEQFEKRNPNTRVFQMTRSAFAGMQRYTFGWSGDVGNGNNMTEGWGQLEAQLPLALSAGISGIPFWSCDISGYCGDIKDYEAMSELYVRWIQFGAFNPLSRIHHEGNNAVEPWLFGAEAELLSKEAIELKYRLFPYIYSYSREAFETGLPIMRAMSLEFPEDKQCENLNSQFMFGAELLVAPVFEEGASLKKVYLPKGEWFDFNHPQVSYIGGNWIEYPVELKTIPMFVKSGSIIPTMPVMNYIGEKSDYPLILDVFPAKVNKKAKVEIYEDDGETNNYKRNVYVKRLVQCESKIDQMEIGYNEKVENNFEFKNRDLIYKLHLKDAPSGVLLSDKKMKPFKVKTEPIGNSIKIELASWNWDKESGILTIYVPATLKNEKLVIEK